MSRRIFFAALAACVLAIPAAAQQQAQIRLDLSPTGEAVVKRYLGAPNPQAQALTQRAADLNRQVKAVLAAPKLDVARFGALLRQQEQLQSQLMRLANDRMLRMLNELSEADRTAFVRGMSNPVMTPAQPAKK